VGFSMWASGTSSTRTSWSPWKVRPRMSTLRVGCLP